MQNEMLESLFRERPWVHFIQQRGSRARCFPIDQQAAIGPDSQTCQRRELRLVDKVHSQFRLIDPI